MPIRIPRHSTSQSLDAKMSSDWGSEDVCSSPKTALEAAPKPSSALFDSPKSLFGNMRGGLRSARLDGRGRPFGFENWSHDGKYLYAEDYSDKTDDMARVSVLNGKEERLLNLKEIARWFDPWEFWVGLAPDDSLLLMRDRSTQEIYSLDVRFP